MELSNKLLRTLETGSLKSHSVVNLLNSKLYHIQLSPSSRLEERLRIEISRIESAYKKCKGARNRLEFDSKVKTISVMSPEIINVQGLKLQSDLSDLNSESRATLNPPESSACLESTSNNKENIPSFNNSSSVRVDNASKNKQIKRL